MITGITRKATLSLLGVGLMVVALACGPAATPTPSPTPTATTAPRATQPFATSTPTPTATATRPAQPTPTATPTPTLPVLAPTPTPGTTVQVPQPKSPVGTITFVVPTVPSGVGLNRAQAPESYMYLGITEQLFRPQGDELVGPWLATDWQIAPDFSQATITIRSGVQFHKGWGELTAHDIAWSANDTNAAITPTSIHGQAGDLAAFLGEARATDDRTLVLPFIAPEPRWNTLLFNQAGDSFGVFPKRAFDEMGEDWMRENIIGTGPFQVLEWVKDDRAVLEALPQHWDAVPKFKQLRMLAIPEASGRVAMMETGEADIASTLPLKDVQALVNKGFKVTSSGRQTGIPVNFAGNYWEETAAKTGQPLDHPTMVNDIPWIGNPFSPNDSNNPQGIDDMEQARLVRWALAMAIDRDLAVETVYANLALPYYVGMFHPTDPNWQDKWEVPYDPVKAEEFLDRAGYPRGAGGVRFEMPIYSFTNNPEWGEAADVVAGFWDRVGVKTSILKVNYSIVRPNLVSRSITIPGTQSCRSDIWLPWDWPRGEEETSLTRGGFGCYVESPFVLDIFRRVSVEPDLQKRIELNNQLADYLYHQMLKAGFVIIPSRQVYNPNSIAEWNMRRSPQNEYNSFELLVPAR